MVEFISELKEKKEDKTPLEQYFEEKIVPLVDADNRMKNQYHSLFWGFLWTIMFIVSVKILFVLFSALMHKHAINYGPLILFSLCAFSLVYWPIYKYYREPRQDIFDVFISFYGSWQHKPVGEVRLVHSPVIPPHDTVGANHNITSSLDDISVQMRDTYYKNYLFKSKKWQRTISTGVVVYLTFPENFNGTLLIFDKGGFYKKSKFPDLDSVSPKIEIPASNYFKCFTDNKEFAQNIMVSLFYETLLDMKDAFDASHAYVEIRDNIIRMYFENSALYFDSYKFWSRNIDKNKFLQLDKEFDKTFNFIKIMKVLIE